MTERGERYVTGVAVAAVVVLAAFVVLWCVVVALLNVQAFAGGIG